MKRVLLNKQIYSQKAIATAISEYKSILLIDISDKDTFYELSLKRLKNEKDAENIELEYEFTNYLLSLVING